VDKRSGFNAQRYINEVLNAEAVPFMQRNGPVVFQQENARPHTTRITRARLAAANVNTMQWPAMSPDMNPIEHIWDMLGRDVRRHHAPQTILQLTNALIEEWNNLPNTLVQRSSILCVDALTHYLEPEVTTADIE
jgi:transposase